MSLENDLQRFGLEEKEAKVYLAALELGETNIQKLTQKSGIKRSTVYEMIKKLSTSGLITESIKGKRKAYLASEPEKLKHNIKEKEQLLSQMLPELRSLNNASATKPKITYYEGRDGLRNIYITALEAKYKKADWISPISTVTETVGKDFLEKYVETKKKMGYWIRSIHILSRGVETYKYTDPKTYEETLRKVRFAPKEIDIPDAIGIWDNKVAVLSSRKEGFGLIIESEDYTKTMRVFYELLWNASKTWQEMNSTAKDSKDNPPADEESDDYWS